MRATTPREPETAVAAVQKLLSSSGVASGLGLLLFSQQSNGVGLSREASSPEALVGFTLGSARVLALPVI